jgi:hypothetical protein
MTETLTDSRTVEIHFPHLERLWEHLFELKCRGAFGCEAYATLSKDTTVRGEFTGRHDGCGPVFGPELHLKAGTTVRIVMVSRMGDVGWTPDLSESVRYVARTDFTDNDTLINCRLERR